MAGTPVESLTEADLAGTTELVARDRAITDLTGMAQLANLQILDLAANEIEDLSPLSGLLHLQMLDLGHNRIRDLSPLRTLAQLQSLILNDNEIEDVSPLLELPLLSSVELLGNPLGEQSLTIHIPALQARDVEVLSDPGQPPAADDPEEPSELQGSWRALGPEAGATHRASVEWIALAPSDPEVMYAATANGLWRSTTGGQDWTPTRLMQRVRRVYVAANDANKVYTASIVGFGQAEHLLSSDGGTTWGSVDVPGTLLSVDPMRPGRLYAVRGVYDDKTNTGYSDFFLSDDDGDTWREIGRTDGFPIGHFVHVHPANPQTIYVGSKRFTRAEARKVAGLYTSIDGGATWSRLQLGREVWDLWPDARDPEGLWGVDAEGVWYSGDGGVSWESQASVPVVGVCHLTVHPLDAEWMWTWRSERYGELWASREGGETWIEPAADAMLASVVQVVPHPRDAKRAFWVQNEDGCGTLRTTADGGGHWEGVDLVGDWRSVDAVGVSASGALYASSWRLDGRNSIPVVFASGDGGSNWEAQELSGQGISGWFTMLYFDPCIPDMVLAYDPLVGFVLGGGEIWETLTLSEGHGSGVRIDPEAVAARGQHGATVYYVVDPGDGGLYRSVAGPDTWEKVKEDVSAVAVSPVDAQMVFVGGSEDGEVWASRDGGGSWSNLGVVAEGSRVARLGIHALAPTRVYAVTTTGVFVSEDEGETWSAPLLSFVLPRLSGTRIRFDPGDARVVYVSTGPQLWATRDGGQSWRSLLEAEDSPTWIHDLAIDPADSRRLYVATPRGAYRWEYGSVTAVRDEHDVVPVSFSLQPNYPNPFNGETVIGYGVPAAGPVELTVYNVLGQRVASLVREEQAPGPHEVVWDGRDASGRELATGMYLCRLRSGGQVAVRRMLLLR